MRLFATFLAAAAMMFGAIDGTVVNKTSGKPQSGVKVTMTKLGQGGMQPGGSAVTDASGKFHIDSDAASAHLLQAVWQGVTYNLSLQPGAPTTNVELPVYDALPKLSAVEVTQHMILLETNGQELVVNETIIFQNDSLTTWNDPKSGTARISVPDGVGENIRARVIAPGGLPIERPVSQAVKGMAVVDYPVKPGETRFDFSYRMPAGTPATFSSKILHDTAPVRLIIPQGITAEGEGITSLGTEPTSQATVYDIKGQSFKVTLTGSGELRAAEEQPAPDEGQRISTILPPGYERAWKWALGLALAFLAIGFWVQYIKQPQGAPAGGKRKA